MSSPVPVTFLVLLLQFVLIAQHGMRLTLTAPTVDKPTFENEIPTGSDGDLKHFRVTYAQRMKSYMNASIDPCDDFYEYACGNYPNVIEDLEVNRKRSNLLDIFFVLLDLTNNTLHRTRNPEEEYYEELQKAKQFLKSCVNTKLYPVEASEEYLDVVRTIGGFPALDPSWNASQFDWFKMTAYLTRYGIEGLVKESIYLKHPFPPYYELPKLGFDFDIYLENIATKQSEGYTHSEKIMRDLLKIYGADSNIEKVIDGVIGFWREVLLMDKTINDYGGCSITMLMEDTHSEPFSKWSSFFETAWSTTEFNKTEISDCPCDWYYNKLDAVVTERPEDVANYMALKFLYSMHPHHMKSEKFQNLNCVTRVKHAFPVLMTHFYMKEHYNQQAEEDIYEIVSELKKSLKHLIETADWLDEPTRYEALSKVQTLRTRIGQITDPISDVLIKEMKKLNFTDNFASNNLQLVKYEVDMQHYGNLHHDLPDGTLPPDLLDAVQVNAFYYVLENSINIMAGVLHPPVYHSSLPKSVKYGSLGYILGHELTHGFDNMGSNFDANLTRRHWWTDKAAGIFDERSNCFAQHYSGYSVPELNKKINGSTSQDENIADSGGLREALAAYRKVSKIATKNKDLDLQKRDTLPGIDLNSEQLFFLSFAQLYCSKYTAKHFWVEISNEHPLDKYRVLGSLQNFEEFPLVYNCPLGSAMNPNEKCRLW